MARISPAGHSARRRTAELLPRGSAEFVISRDNDLRSIEAVGLFLRPLPEGLVEGAPVDTGPLSQLAPVLTYACQNRKLYADGGRTPSATRARLSRIGHLSG
jgi:hypothetical protein